jgi:hypothetical protein
MRTLLVALVALGLMGFCLVSWAGFLAHSLTVGESLDCGRFTERPQEGWVRLEGCLLDFDSALLSDGAATVERLTDRRNGLWQRLPDGPVTWAQVLVPVKTAPDRARPARVVLVLEDPDILAWVNSLERAEGEEHARILRRAGLLDRFVAPNFLAGDARRGEEAEAVRLRLGRDGASGLVLLQPGPEPATERPLFALALGALGAGTMLWALSSLDQRGRARRLTAAEEAALADVSGVEPELGALEALRREERSGKQGDEPPS